MKELTPAQLASVSGGVTAGEQITGFLKGIYGWLKSDANPLNGHVVGKTIGDTIGGFFLSIAQQFVKLVQSR